jgi:hypothetical protein
MQRHLVDNTFMRLLVFVIGKSLGSPMWPLKTHDEVLGPF